MRLVLDKAGLSWSQSSSAQLGMREPLQPAAQVGLASWCELDQRVEESQEFALKLALRALEVAAQVGHVVGRDRTSV